MSKNICCHISQAMPALCSCSIRCQGTIDKSVRKLPGIKFLKHLLVTGFGFDLGIQIFLIAYTRQWSLIPISATPESEKFHGWLVKNKSIIDYVSCVIIVGWSINWLSILVNITDSSFCVLQSGDFAPTLQFRSPIMSTSIWYDSNFCNTSSNLFIISVVDLGGLYQVHTTNGFAFGLDTWILISSMLSSGRSVRRL